MDINKIKISKCKAKAGRFNLDNGNVIIEVDIELDTKEITKNIALKVENFIEAAPDLLEAAEKALDNLNFLAKAKGLIIGGTVELREAINKAKGDD
jgi:phage tail sheath gpL-like